MSDLLVPDQDAEDDAEAVDRDGTSGGPETVAYGGSVWRTTVAGAQPMPCVTLRGDDPASPAPHRPRWPGAARGDTICWARSRGAGWGPCCGAGTRT
jgi:hypothetical protein